MPRIQIAIGLLFISLALLYGCAAQEVLEFENRSIVQEIPLSEIKLCDSDRCIKVGEFESRIEALENRKSGAMCRPVKLDGLPVATGSNLANLRLPLNCITNKCDLLVPYLEERGWSRC